MICTFQKLFSFNSFISTILKYFVYRSLQKYDILVAVTPRLFVVCCGIVFSSSYLLTITERSNSLQTSQTWTFLSVSWDRITVRVSISFKLFTNISSTKIF